MFNGKQTIFGTAVECQKSHKIPLICWYIMHFHTKTRTMEIQKLVAQLSLASKEVANGYTPYHKINKLGIHIRKEMWLT